MIELLKKTVGVVIKIVKFCFVFPASLIIMSTIKASLLFNIGKIIAFTKAVCNGKYRVLKESFNLLDEKIQTSKSFNDLLNNIDNIEELKSILVVLDDFKNLWATTDQCKSNLKRLIDSRHRLPLLQDIFTTLRETNLFKGERAQANFNGIFNRNLDQELLMIFTALKNTDLFDDFKRQQEIVDELSQRTNPQIIQVSRVLRWASSSKIFEGKEESLANFEKLFKYDDNSKIFVEVFESLQDSGLLTGDNAIDCFNRLYAILSENSSCGDTTLSTSNGAISVKLTKLYLDIFVKLRKTIALTSPDSALTTFNMIFSICELDLRKGDSQLATALNSILDSLDLDSLFINSSNAEQAKNTLFQILKIQDNSLLNSYVEILVHFKKSTLLSGDKKYYNLNKILQLQSNITASDLDNVLSKIVEILGFLNANQLLEQDTFDVLLDAAQKKPVDPFIESAYQIEEIPMNANYKLIRDMLAKNDTEFRKKFFMGIINPKVNPKEFTLAIQHLNETPLLTDENSDKVIQALVDAGDKAVEVAKSFKHLIGTGLLADDDPYTAILAIKSNKTDAQANLQVANQILDFLNQNALNLLTADNLSRILRLTKTDAQTVLQALQYFKESRRRDLLDQASFDLLLSSPTSSVAVARLLTYSKTKNTLHDFRDIVQGLKVEQLGQEYKNMALVLTEEQAQVIHKLVGNLASAHAMTFNILATLLSYKDDKDADGKLLLTTLWEAIRLIDDAEGEFTFAPLLSQEFAKYPALLAIALKFHLYSKITDADIAIRQGSSAGVLEQSKKQEVEKLVQQRVQAQFEQITRYQITAKPNELTEQIFHSLASICMDKLDKDHAISPKGTAVVEGDSSSKNILGTYQLLIRVLDEQASSTLNAARGLVGRESSDPQSVAVVATSLYKALGSIKMPSSDLAARNLMVDFASADEIDRSAMSAAAVAG